MEAIKVSEEDYAVVDASVCIGCGACTPICPSESVDLALRGKVQPPPKPEEVFASRLKM